ncbi:MAG TPA: FGGY family carbohydrate kinase [Acidimicrobiales bacterium]|nr:FGGY family carbohydrate kinase [Acidimicrobiales bacterium]
MRRRPVLLGLDLGTTRVKAVLMDEAGAEVVVASAPTPFASGPAGTEMGAGELLDVVGTVLTTLGDDRAGVAGVGVAGIAESGAPVDAEGAPLAPVIAWHDPRGAEVVARLQERFGDELALAIGQRVRTVTSVAKLGWLVDAGVRGTHRWLGVPELCLHGLTGVQATEHSLAARTGCFDVQRRCWLPEVAEAAGFDVGVFPPVGTAGSTLGRVSTRGGVWSGLPEGAPVTLAGHDHLAGMTGCGAAKAGLANSVGTAETVVGRSSKVPDVALALAHRVAVTLAPGGDGWAVLASAARAGRILETTAAALGRSPAELDRLAENAGQGAEVGDLLADVDAGDDLRVPREPPGEVWWGLLRALSARTGEAVDRASEIVGPAPGLVVFGGGSRSRPWLRAKADALTLAVVRSTAAEAAARGAAVQAGVAAGWWPSAEAAPAPVLEPVPAQERP